MQVNYTGHHVDVTPPLRNYTEEKLARLQRHSNKIISIDFTFEVNKLEQIAKATIFASGAKFHADSTTEDMYSSIDSLIDKLDRQIKRHKTKMTDHHHD